MFSFWQREEKIRTRVDDLRPGHFIELERGWFKHNFLRSKFLIESPHVIDALRAAGISTVLLLPGKSRPEALAGTAAEPLAVPESPAPLQSNSADGKKDQRNEKAEPENDTRRGEEMRRRQELAEQAHSAALAATEFVMKSLLARPGEAAESARALVSESIDTVMADDATLHLLASRHAETSMRFHALQVMTLSLIVGRRLGLTREELDDLASAALFHDVGIFRLQDSVRISGESGSRSSQEAYRAHVYYSVEMVRNSAAVSKNALVAILTHHEAVNGSGYPSGLRNDDIPLAGRILAIADRYDYLVNPAASPLGMAPAEALARLFQSESARFDKRILHAFAKAIGIYPPGSIVQLSDGRYGMVIGINANMLMCPSVLVHEPSLPRNQAPVVDLLEAGDLNVKKCLPAALVPRDVLDYLNPSSRVAYFYSGSRS